MEKKRVFQALDEMNVIDCENKGSRLVALQPTMIAADKVKQGGIVKMGVSPESFMDIFNETHMPILLVVEKKRYFEIMNGDYPKVETPELIK